MAKKRVLIVDDAIELGRLLQAGLATIDPMLEVTLVPSGEEASLETSRHPIDLVVVDVRLPGVSGLDLTRRIRARHKDTRIIQISGLGEAGLKEKAMAAGADCFFAKPLNLDEFLKEASRLLGLGTELPAVVQSITDYSKLDAWLHDLRLASGAQAGAVLDVQGKVLAKDGEWGDAVMAGGLLAELAHTALQAVKLSRSMGSAAPEAAWVLRGGSYDVVAACSEGELVTLLGCLRGRSQVRLPIAVEEALAAQKILREAASQQAVAQQAVFEPDAPAVSAPQTEAAPLSAPENLPEPAVLPVPAPLPAILAEPVIEDVEVDETEAADLAALFGGGASLGQNDLDSFWDSAGDEAAKRPINPDTLSYDQAQKMGLAPDDESSGG